MGFAVEEALDELYSAVPAEFTRVRTRLAAAAKQSGDADAARRIGGSRKPSTAAWLVNTLVIGGSARTVLTDLGSRLRQAHAAMDGATIRALTAEQRTVVHDLTGAALRRAGIAAPSAALRDDVTATLLAAVADPEVADRLGRLAKAEQWSGFGDFGLSAAVAGRSKAPQVSQAREAPNKGATTREGRAALAAAERAKAQADAAVTELQSNLARARRKRDDARRRLESAEQALTAAEDAYAAGKQAAKDAATAVRAAKR